MSNDAPLTGIDAIDAGARAALDQARRNGMSAVAISLDVAQAMYDALDQAGAAFGRATLHRADLAAIETLRAALTEARAFVAADLRGTLGCVCVLDPVTHEPIESTIDPEEVEHVAHIKGVLARIDAALGDQP